MKCKSVSSAKRRAMVVLPTPGGPQKISDDREPESSMTPKGASGPRTCSCPITSPRLRGRRRSARGRGAVSGTAAPVSKRSAMMHRRPDNMGIQRKRPAVWAGLRKIDKTLNYSAASSAATRALSAAPFASTSRSTNSMIAIGAMSP